MKYFRKLDLPNFDIPTTTLDWKGNNQICLNTIEDGPDDYTFGCGSLTRDWSKMKIIDGVQTVPLRDSPMKEKDFTKLVSDFKGTVFEDVYNCLKQNYSVGRVRLMKLFPKQCMSWHDDAGPRIHYPIQTQTGAMMVIEDEVMHIPQNEWWFTDTTKYHTAFNSSPKERVHLVAAVIY